MKSKTKTRFAVVVAGALMTLSSSALAQDGKSSALKLSDAELDQITAGQGAISEVVLFNPGKGPGEPKINNRHVTCINCPVSFELPSGTSGVVNVLTPNGKIVSHFVRQSPFPPQF